MMFRRKKNNHPSHEHLGVEIKKSEDQLESSRKDLDEAKEAASILREIRMENHIVINLREVLGGR